MKTTDTSMVITLSEELAANDQQLSEYIEKMRTLADGMLAGQGPISVDISSESGVNVLRLSR